MEFSNTSVTPSSYECTMTADCAIFGFQDNVLKLLLVRRSTDPFKNEWLLPGGIMNNGQTLEESVNKILFNLTGIDKIHQEQVKCYSAVDRHPVKRVVTICFYALIKPENHPVIAKNYVSEVKWFSLDELPKMAIDHNQLATDALSKLRDNLKQKLIFGELLAKKFTLKELQDLYESILNEKLDRRNFRKKMKQMNLLSKTSEKKIGVKGGPNLYTIKE